MGLFRVLASFGEEGELASGLHPSAGEEQVPFWLTGRNVDFYERGVASAKGFNAPFVTAGSTPIRGMAQQLTSGLTQALFYGNQTTIYRWNAVTEDVVGSGYTGQVDGDLNDPVTVWSMDQWGNFVFATNGVDAPQIYKGTSFADWTESDASPLPFTTAEIVLARGPHALVLNTSNGFNWVEWSDEDDVEDWTPVAENAAGNLVIRELDSPIVAAVPLGEAIAVYGREQMFLLRYLGAPFYFGYTPVLSGFGPVSKAAVVTVGRRNYGFGRGGLWVTDGAQYEELGRNSVHEYLQQNVNWTQAGKVVGYHDEEFNRVVWSYPTGSENDECVSFDYKRGRFSFNDYGRTSFLRREVFKWPVAADASGNVYFHNVGSNADGNALTKTIQTRPVAFGDASVMKLLQALRVGFQSKSGVVEVRVGVQKTLDDSITWSSWMTVPGNGPLAPVDALGEWMRLEFRSTAVSAEWIMDTLTLYGVPIGGSLL